MEAIGEAVRAYATVGEIMGALAAVFGRWQRSPGSEPRPGCMRALGARYGGVRSSPSMVARAAPGP